MFWLRWVFVAVRGLSLVESSRGATLRCSAQASHCGGFSCCRAQALGMRASVVVARRLSSCGSSALEGRLSSCGLVGPRHVGSSWTRAQTWVPCIGRWILNHCTTREAPLYFSLKQSLLLSNYCPFINSVVF